MPKLVENRYFFAGYVIRLRLGHFMRISVDTAHADTSGKHTSKIIADRFKIGYMPVRADHIN